MSNEWQALDLQNLPGTDVFKPGVWEWQHRPKDGDWGNIFKGISHEKYPSGSGFSLPLDGEIRIRRPEEWEPERCPTHEVEELKRHFECQLSDNWEIKPYKIKRYNKLVGEQCDKPKAPTHEEILAPRFWKDDDGRWNTITGYYKDTYRFGYGRDRLYMRPEYFINRESADMPPAS